ncbi:MAG: hypothetical protein SGARI_007873, partial [Bacillariaceae sp.]
MDEIQDTDCFNPKNFINPDRFLSFAKWAVGKRQEAGSPVTNLTILNEGAIDRDCANWAAAMFWRDDALGANEDDDIEILSSDDDANRDGESNDSDDTAAKEGESANAVTEEDKKWVADTLKSRGFRYSTENGILRVGQDVNRCGGVTDDSA